ncbi:MAG: ABC transporter permease [Blastocatellia bacterium]
MIHDFRYAIRMLFKRRSLTFACVLTLALGIGANTAIFSVINSVLLSPLPLYQSDRLAVLSSVNLSTNETLGSSYPNFQDWRRANSVFEDMATVRGYGMTLTGPGDAERIDGARVSSSFFDVLHAVPALGRTFLPAEDIPGSAPVVVVSNEFWRARLGSDPAAVGRQITLDGIEYTVVGVLNKDFNLPLLQANPQVWETIAQDTSNQAERGAAVCIVFGRLKPDASLASARTDINTIAAELSQKYPDTNAGLGVHIVGLQDQLVGKFKSALWILFAAVGLLLLIACTNVASLLLARANARGKEIAIRTALGAGRIRIVRQLLTESSLLALTGGTAGLLLTSWAVEGILSLGPDELVRVNHVRIDSRVLIFTVLVSVLTGVVFGLAPSIKLTRLSLNDSLKEGGRHSSSGMNGRAGGAFIISEVALALVLLVGAGLLMRSFIKLANVSPGFDSANVLTMRLALPRTKYPKSAQSIEFYRQTLERIRLLPGVLGADFVTPAPFSHSDVTTDFQIESRPAPTPGSNPTAAARGATPSYFQTMRIPLREGRWFSDFDKKGGVGAAIINETLAKQYWPGEDPVGKYISHVGVSVDDDEPQRWQIVGVVGDVRHSSLSSAPVPTLYMPHNQMAWRWGYIVVRTAGDPMTFAGPVREQILAVDKDQAVSSVRSMNELIGVSVAQPRFYMALLGVFAALGLVLAAIGIHGVVSYSTAERTREIGVRMALGASRRDVLSMILRHGMALAGTGVVVGVGASLILTKLMAGLLFEVGSTDPLTLGGTVALLLLVALTGSYLPARKAIAVDPMIALRHE